MNQNMNQMNNQNEYLDNTVGSLNFSMTEGSLASTVYEESTDLMYKIELQKKNSSKPNQNTDYTAKVNNNVTTTPSTTTKKNPNDERPLPTLSSQKILPKTVQETKKVEKEDDYDDYEDEFEEYEDDFEEYNSDEDDDTSRLTMKANDKDLSVIVDLYKEKLNYKKKDSFKEEGKN